MPASARNVGRRRLVIATVSLKTVSSSFQSIFSAVRSLSRRSFLLRPHVLRRSHGATHEPLDVGTAPGALVERQVPREVDERRRLTWFREVALDELRELGRRRPALHERLQHERCLTNRFVRRQAARQRHDVAVGNQRDVLEESGSETAVEVTV